MTVRALIVDDSPTIRGLLAAMLRRDPEIEVVGTAAEPLKARSLMRSLDPDVVTLDVEMPGMDGLDFLERIMRLRPTPVVMVSSLTTSGASATLRALELGAVDCFAKPTGGLRDLLESGANELIAKVKGAAGCRGRLARPTASSAPPDAFDWNGRMIAIGASTGGVEAIGALLSAFPENCPPTLIVQHMPMNFTRMFASRLHSRVKPNVVEAEDGMPIRQGTVYIAPAAAGHLTVGGRQQPVCKIVQGPPVSGHQPAADMLFRSVAALDASRATGIILTGMGQDGAAGLREMHARGMPTIGQDEASSLIYGMPRAAFELGALSHVLPLGSIAPRVLELCQC